MQNANSTNNSFLVLDDCLITLHLLLAYRDVHHDQLTRILVHTVYNKRTEHPCGWCTSIQAQQICRTQQCKPWQTNSTDPKRALPTEKHSMYEMRVRVFPCLD